MPKRKLPIFQYRVIQPARPDYNPSESVGRTGDQEQLTGMVNGMKASDLEERSAASIGKLGIGFTFRQRISSQALGRQHLQREFLNIRGEVEIDFLCDDGGLMTPIFVDGQIGHFYTAWQADQDKEKADAVDAFGAQLGWNKSVRVPFWKLQDQNSSDKTYREIFR